MSEPTGPGKCNSVGKHEKIETLKNMKIDSIKGKLRE